jgi:hypothetical protein
VGGLLNPLSQINPSQRATKLVRNNCLVSRQIVINSKAEVYLAKYDPRLLRQILAYNKTNETLCK